MKRCIPCLLALIMVVALGVSVQAAEPVVKPFFVHFVVVPAKLSNGLSSGGAMLNFKKAVIELAGGYTDLGATRGGSIEHGGVKQQENLSLLIGADEDITRQLKKLSITHFGGDGAFIMSWPGKVMF